MGQQQSSGAKGGATPEQSERKTDYYQLLGLEQNASEEEIKKAYRKKALELHPDRNYGNVEDSTALFAEVQCAYEVLSDVQERAWYDSHRDAILRSDDTSQGNQYSYDVRMTTTDDILKLFLNFNPRMDFTDSPTGFFGGLRETFDQLAREENVACQWENGDPIDYPSFGSRDDDYNDVVRPFYAAWNGFATKKTFSWKDVHRYSEAPDRRIRRLMEKENRRLREEAVREFNDAVRSLVAFARKRDPRCKANAQNEAERQRSLREAAAAQAARSRAANEAKIRAHTVPEWAQTEDPDAISSESEAESEKIHLECVVCRKTFKSEKQFEAHERSKKHIKAVKQLRWEMRVEDKELDLEQTGDDSVPSNNMPVEEPLRSEAVLPDDEPGSTSHTNNDNSDAELASVRGHATSNGQDTGSDASLDDRDEVKKSDDDAPEEPAEDGPTVNDQSETVPSSAEPVDGLAEKLSTTSVANDDGPPVVKMGKAKLKRAKKAAAQSAPQDIRCMACQATFPSNTRLFNHVKELNHAQPVSKPGKSKKR